MSRTQNEARSNATLLADGSFNRHAFDLSWGRVARFTAPTVALSAILGGLVAMTLGAGCTSKNPDLSGSTTNPSTSETPRASALDVGPVRPSAPVDTPAEAPASPAPSSAPLPDPASTPTLASTEAVGGVPADGSTYIVQHGDTLFRIAKQHYGDGKQWARIASANPGLTPATLKAGQKIILP